MDEATFKRRTKRLAVDAIALVEGLPQRPTTTTIARQLLRAMTSIGANYRASCRARSYQEIVAKLSIVEEEADESLYWLELLVESGLVDAPAVSPIADETEQILRMVVASKKTLKAKYNAPTFGDPNERQPRIVNRESSNRES